MLYYTSGRVAWKGKNTMDKVRYSIYALYSKCGYIYVGMSKNPQLRLSHHFRKSSNHALRKLIESNSIEIYSEILLTNLSSTEAEEAEKYLINSYRNDPLCTVLNVQSGGLCGASCGELSGENCHSSKLLDEEVIKIRHLYAESNITQEILAERFGVSPSTIENIVRGKRSPHLPGPITLNRLENYKVLSDEDVVKIRSKYANFGKKFICSLECKQYNISRRYFSAILKGEARKNLPGPLLGKDYTNG